MYALVRLSIYYFFFRFTRFPGCLCTYVSDSHHRLETEGCWLLPDEALGTSLQKSGGATSCTTSYDIRWWSLAWKVWRPNLYLSLVDFSLSFSRQTGRHAHKCTHTYTHTEYTHNHVHTYTDVSACARAHTHAPFSITITCYQPPSTGIKV